MTWHDLATDAARLGPVFPLVGVVPDGAGGWRCHCGEVDAPGKKHASGKHPFGRTRGHCDATTDPEQIQAWADMIGDLPANVGLAVPDGAAVVDVDFRNGGHTSLENLSAQGLALPLDCVAETGNGLHIWLRLPQGVKLPSTLGPGLDVRQSGNYVVAPGSRHVSGAVYQWSRRGAVPDAPGWVVASSRPATSLGERPPIEGEDIDDAAIDALVERMVDLAVPGEKHYLCWELGSWLGGRGWSGDSIEAVIRRLLEQCPDVGSIDAGVATAFDGTRFPGGWSRIAARLGADAAEVDATVPNPKHAAVLAEREANVAPVQALLEQMTAVEIAPDAPDRYFDLPLVGVVEPAPLERLIQELDIVPGMTTIVAGKPSASKTPFCLSLALALGSGERWLARGVQRTRAVYLAFEKPIATNRKRVRLARAMGVNPAACELLDMRKFPLDAPGTIERIGAVLKIDPRPTVVFLDTYGAAVLGVNHNDAAFADPLRRLAGELTDLGAAFVPIMHARKGGGAGKRDDVEGTVHLVAAADAVIGLTQSEDDPYVVEVSSVRPAEDGFSPIRVRWVNVSDEAETDPRWGLACVVEQSAGESAQAAQRSGTQSQAVDAALARIASWVQVALPAPQTTTYAQLAVVAQAPRVVVDRAISAAVKLGHLAKAGTHAGVPHYSAPLPSSGVGMFGGAPGAE